MRLADFFQCGCRSLCPEEAPPEAGPAAATPCPPASPRNCRRRRRRRLGTGKNAFTPWRPSLSAISENASATVATARDGKVVPTPAEAVKASAGGYRRVLPRSHGDDQRYIDVSLVVPVFSPTAYLF